MKTLLIIEPAFSGLDLIAAAYHLNFSVHIVSAQVDDRSIPEKYTAFITAQHQVDTNSEAQLLEKVMALHRQYQFAAVIPGSEYHVAITARIVEHIDCLGLPRITAMALRDKLHLHLLLEHSSIRTIPYAVIQSVSEIRAQVARVGLPAVIKPLAMAGSLGVKKVETLAEVEEAYLAICENTLSELGHTMGKQALLEQYIQGDEYSIEGWVDRNGIHIVSITQKQLGPEPYFVEIGHIVGASLPAKLESDIRAYTETMIRQLNVNIGAFHLELRCDEQGPVIIEIAGRIGGDCIAELVQLAKGVDLNKAMILSYLGENYQADLTKRLAAVIFYFLPLGQRQYHTIEGIERLKALSGFVRLHIIAKANVPIADSTTFLGRVAYAIFTNETDDALKATLATARQTLKFT